MHEPSRSHRPKSIPRRGQWYLSRTSNGQPRWAGCWNSISYSVLAISASAEYSPRLKPFMGLNEKAISSGVSSALFSGVTRT